MPTLVNKLIFGLIPSQLPFLIRPVGSMIFSGVSKQLLDPNLKKQFDYIADELSKKPSVNGVKWFAGGDEDGNPVCLSLAHLSCLISF